MMRKYMRVAFDTLRTQISHLREENVALHGTLGETRRQLREAQWQLAERTEERDVLRIQLADARLQLEHGTALSIAA